MFVLDTSALIGAWARTYPPDVLPGLWDHFDDMATNGEIVAPEEVLMELADRDDDLHAWVTKRKDKLIIPTTRGVMVGARSVLQRFPNLTKSGTGRGRADPFVIALAEELDATVVTEERGGSDRKPRIPFVCNELGIECVSMLQVIRDQDLTFRRAE